MSHNSIQNLATSKHQQNDWLYASTATKKRKDVAAKRLLRTREWVSSFLTAHQHADGYLVPFKLTRSQSLMVSQLGHTRLDIASYVKVN